MALTLPQLQQLIRDLYGAKDSRRGLEGTFMWFMEEVGELSGALLLARKAAEAYAPEAKAYLAEVYTVIFECEMRRNRPVAARAIFTATDNREKTTTVIITMITGTIAIILSQVSL